MLYYPTVSYVVGSPLHYVVDQSFWDYDFWSKMAEESNIRLASSPNSVQSDSDTSTISLDYQLSPKLSLIQCRWSNCGQHVNSLDQLATHVSQYHAVSSRNGVYYCQWDGCPRLDKGFNARYKMLVHVRTHTNEKPHSCVECGKSFSRAENLKIHARSHSGEKPYLCPVTGCNKAYSNSSDRFKHTRTHQVDKPYRCKVEGCDKKYTDPSSLRKHVKTYKHYAPSSDENMKPERHLTVNDESTITNHLNDNAEPSLIGWPHFSTILQLKSNDEYSFHADMPLDLSIARKH